MRFGALGVTPIINTMSTLIARNANGKIPLTTIKGEWPMASEITSSAAENIPSARNSNQNRVTVPRSTSAT